jgi:hypothetical protein
MNHFVIKHFHTYEFTDKSEVIRDVHKLSDEFYHGR